MSGRLTPTEAGSTPAQLVDRLIEAFNALTHKHRWSGTLIYEPVPDVVWRACACGARQEYLRDKQPRIVGGIHVEL